MKQEQLYWQIFTYNLMIVGNCKEDCASNWAFTWLYSRIARVCTIKSSIVCSILCIFCCAHVTDIRFGYDWISLSQSVHHIKKEVSGQIISYSYQYDSNQHNSKTMKCLTICTPPQSSLETVIVYFTGNVPYCTTLGIFRFYAIISYSKMLSHGWWNVFLCTNKNKCSGDYL